MIYFHSYDPDNEVLERLISAGFDVAVYDISMTDQELYDTVMEADLVLLDHSENDSFEEGFVRGLAVAFGKVVYVAPGNESDLEGHHPYPTLLEAAEALLKEQEPDDAARLDGDDPQPGSGADADGGA